MATFNIYPLDGDMFSVETDSFHLEHQPFKLHGRSERALAFLANKDQFVALYRTIDPPVDWRLEYNQPRCFKVYLRNHSASPLEIYAHYFKVAHDGTLEFWYTKFVETNIGALERDDLVPDVYVKLAEVLAIVSSEPLPAPSKPE